LVGSKLETTLPSNFHHVGDATIDYLNSVETNIDHALKVLDGETNASDEQLLVYAFRATQYSGGGVIRRATFDELTSTGSLGLIADKKLLNTAMLLYNSGIVEEAMTEGINSAYRIEFRKMLSVDVQVALNERCGDKFVPIGDYSVIGHQLNYACKTGLQPAQIEKAANVLRADPEFVALLRLRAMNVRSQLSNLSFSNQDLRESLRTIAGSRP
jgi:hypothetical protein